MASWWTEKAPHDPEFWAERIKRWRLDPVRFVWENFGAEPWRKQRDILLDLALHHRVAVRAGHGVGKSAVFAWATWWQLICWDHSVVLATAPTFPQLNDVLWAEIARWRVKLHPYLQAQFKQVADHIYHVDHRETWFVTARTARKENPESMAGLHVKDPNRLMLLLEEASGIPEPIFEVLEGALSTDGVRVLMQGNPTRTVGYFRETFHKARELWVCHKVSCLEAPPRIVSPDYAERIAKRYGTDSNVYRVRVEGEFPRTDDDSVVPLEWAEAALARELPEDFFYRSNHEVTLRVDVARFGGDDTAMMAVQGRAILGIWVWHGNDTSVSAAKVAMMAKRIHEWSEELDDDGRLSRPAYYPRIIIDSAGVGGGVADKLNEFTDEDGNRLFQVIEVNSGEAADEPDQFDRLRSELWWKARLWFQDASPVIAPAATDPEQCSLIGWSPTDPRIDRELRERLTAELSIPKYWFRDAGRLHVESKQEVKDRIGGEEAKSPDVADALNLGFAQSAYWKVEPITGTRWARRAVAGRNKFMRLG